VEFLVDAPDVGADGTEADAQLIGDLLVEEASGEEGEDLFFAKREQFQLRIGFGCGTVEPIHDLASDGRGHGGTALVQLLNGLEELGGRAFLDEVAIGTGFQRFEDMVVIFEDGEHHEASVRERSFEPTDAIDAGHSGEVNIHEDDVGFEGGKLCESFFSALACGEALKTWSAFEKKEEGLAFVGAILDEGDFDG
jgi:hypothetical protein